MEEGARQAGLELGLAVVSLFEDRLMPTYDYRCGNCGHEFELFQSMSARVLKKCPQCEKLSLKRLIGSGAAVLFKGSGFYTTDYRSESYQKQAKAEKDKQSTKTDKSKTKQSGTADKKKSLVGGDSKPQKKSG